MMEDSRPRRSYSDREPSGDGDDRSKGGLRYKPVKKKACRFCTESIVVDYKNIRVLKSFITERYKIVPARITGTCARHQRVLTTAVKRARQLALIPFTTNHQF